MTVQDNRPAFHVPTNPMRERDPQDPFTAVDAMSDVADALGDNGFDIVRCDGQSLTYKAPNGDRIELRATKKRGR